MEQEVNFGDEAFLVATASRAKLTEKSRAHWLASQVVEVCAGAADAGGGGRQMIEKVADYVEKCRASERDFAGKIATRCVDIASRLDRVSEDGVGAVLRERFGFLQGLIAQDDLDQEQWSSENPMAFHVSITGHQNVNYDQWLAAGERFMDVMTAEIGDNNAIVAAQEAALENGPTSPEAERWEKVVALAKASSLKGLSEQPLINFELIFYYTT
ncbi:MAG: hypothetical protein Q7K57_20480 [Burkholderiaceae bacterium]|nr:hypothetical protein [Burkholderiaceae bacterium]